MSRSSQHRHAFTLAEYLAAEEASNMKHEYLGGEIHAMAGGTLEHSALATELAGMLSAQLADGPFRVFNSDLKIRVRATGLVAYPDMSVFRLPVERDPSSRVVALNPIVLVEVLSDGTEAWDRNEKLEHYKAIPTLEACLLVSHREPLVEQWRRIDPGTWERCEVRRGETVQLASIGCRIDVDRLYRRSFELGHAMG